MNATIPNAPTPMIWKCNLMKKRIWTERVLVVFILLTVGFIFGNSLMNVEKSQNASKAAANAVQHIVEPEASNSVRPAGKPTSHPKVNYFIKYIRDAAHVIEFFVLGLEMALLLTVHEKPNFKSVYLLFSTTVVIAVVDESLQFLNDRGPQVEDILKDTAGASVAIASVLLIYGIAFLVRQRHKKTTNSV